MFQRFSIISAVTAVLFFFVAPAWAQSACDFGSPHPDAPEEIQQFEFLIGNHRIEARIWQDDAFTQGYAPAEWNGRWACTIGMTSR